MPPGTRFMLPLHRILYIHGLIYATLHICLNLCHLHFIKCHYHRKKSTVVSTSLPVTCKLPDVISVTRIIITTLIPVSDLIFDLTHHFQLYSTQFIWLDLNPIAHIYFFQSINLSTIKVNLQEVPHIPECPETHSTAKSWNIPKFWKLKFLLARTL